LDSVCSSAHIYISVSELRVAVVANETRVILLEEVGTGSISSSSNKRDESNTTHAHIHTHTHTRVQILTRVSSSNIDK
jgi:hypothetical protein